MISKYSIWEDSDEGYSGETEQALKDIGSKLGVRLPDSLIKQFTFQDGGYIVEGKDGFPFEDICIWTNAVPDGLSSCDEWVLASDHEFIIEKESDIKNLELLVVLGFCVESLLCLDYRECGPQGLPSVTFLNGMFLPIKDIQIASSIDVFIDALIESKRETLVDDIMDLKLKDIINNIDTYPWQYGVFLEDKTAWDMSTNSAILYVDEFEPNSIINRSDAVGFKYAFSVYRIQGIVENARIQKPDAIIDDFLEAISYYRKYDTFIDFAKSP